MSWSSSSLIASMGGCEGQGSARRCRRHAGPRPPRPSRPRRRPPQAARQALRHRHGPVAVGVGLHHGHQLGRRIGQAAEDADVVPDGLQVHLDPSPARARKLSIVDHESSPLPTGTPWHARRTSSYFWDLSAFDLPLPFCLDFLDAEGRSSGGVTCFSPVCCDAFSWNSSSGESLRAGALAGAGAWASGACTPGACSPIAGMICVRSAEGWSPSAAGPARRPPAPRAPPPARRRS